MCLYVAYRKKYFCNKDSNYPKSCRRDILKYIDAVKYVIASNSKISETDLSNSNYVDIPDDIHRVGNYGLNMHVADILQFLRIKYSYFASTFHVRERRHEFIFPINHRKKWKY